MVPVRLVEEDGARQLIFTWPEPVDFITSMAKGEANIRFKRAAVIDLEQLAAAVPDLSPRVSGGKGGVAVLLKLPTGSRLTAYRTGNLVILNVTPAKRTKPGPPPPQATRAAAAAARRPLI